MKRKTKTEDSAEALQNSGRAHGAASRKPDPGASSSGKTTEALMNLQNTLGNQAVQGLLNTLAGEANSDSSIQPGGLSDLRSRVSRVTGKDLGDVPIERREVRDSRAVTQNGRVALGANATRHDVAHELAHAAQQRASPGKLIGAGEAERQADAVASAALSGENISLPVGRVPSAAVLAAGAPYSREAITLGAPPAGLTIDDLKKQLDLKIKAGDIKGYSIAGVKPGDPEEIFLYNAIILLADKGRWGSELDLVTSIGSAKGMVTVRFDATGNATAQLVGKTKPVVAAKFTKPKDARDALIAQYKLAGIKGEKGKSWSIDELNKILAAWSRLSPVEAAALEGYTLIRTDKLELAGEPLQGLTTHTDDLKPGDFRATHLREMRFADSAFADDDKSFIGDAADAAPASFEVLIHEVGHALEAKLFDDLNALAADDSAKANKAVSEAHAAQVLSDKAIKTAQGGRFTRTDLTTGQPLFDAILAAQKALKEFEKTPDATNEDAAKNALADRDAVKAKIAKGNKVVAALTPASTAQDNYLVLLQKFRAAKETAEVSRSKADALLSGKNTTRLQAFVDFVKKEGIPRPTVYAEKHWPSEPSEFFDEAFSLWKNDPVFFAKYSPKLKKWFDDGKHLK